MMWKMKNILIIVEGMEFGSLTFGIQPHFQWNCERRLPHGLQGEQSTQSKSKWGREFGNRFLVSSYEIFRFRLAFKLGGLRINLILLLIRYGILFKFKACYLLYRRYPQILALFKFKVFASKKSSKFVTNVDYW
jgi:hypothetical protein